MAKTKKEQIAEFEQNGAEWCAKKLYEARERNKELEKIRRKWLYSESLQSIKDTINRTIKQQNENMAEVLADNGVRPHKLLITFMETDCEHCEHSGSEYGECIYCDYDDDFGNWQKIQETISFYSFRITEEEISGITSLFEDKKFQVLKVIDENNGRTLFEREDWKDEKAN